MKELDAGCKLLMRAVPLPPVTSNMAEARNGGAAVSENKKTRPLMRSCESCVTARRGDTTARFRAPRRCSTPGLISGSTGNRGPCRSGVDPSRLRSRPGTGRSAQTQSRRAQGRADKPVSEPHRAPARRTRGRDPAAGPHLRPSARAAPDTPLKVMEFALKRQAQAHRNYMQAMGALLTVQRLPNAASAAEPPRGDVPASGSIFESEGAPTADAGGVPAAGPEALATARPDHPPPSYPRPFSQRPKGQDAAGQSSLILQQPLSMWPHRPIEATAGSAGWGQPADEIPPGRAKRFPDS